jgi:hypothetical protein
MNPKKTSDKYIETMMHKSSLTTTFQSHKHCFMIVPRHQPIDLPTFEPTLVYREEMIVRVLGDLEELVTFGRVKGVEIRIPP